MDKVNLRLKVFTTGFLGLLSIIETDGGIFACLILGLINTDFPTRENWYASPTCT